MFMEDMPAACTSAQHCARIQKSRAEFRSGGAGQSVHTEVVSRVFEKALKAEEMYAKAGNRAYLASTLQAM